MVDARLASGIPVAAKGLLDDPSLHQGIRQEDESTAGDLGVRLAVQPRQGVVREICQIWTAMHQHGLGECGP